MFLPKIVDGCKNDELKSISINLIDIDGFSDFNDQYGHEIADNLLAYYGKRLKELGQGFVAWRIGSDEFLVAYTYSGEDDKAHIVDSLVQELRIMSVKPKDKGDSLKPLHALFASSLFDKSMSIHANINMLYSQIEKQRIQRAKEAESEQEKD